MPEYIIAVGTALWLGILTSISPCPLATNIAAISFIGKNIGKTSAALFSGLFYTLGRTLTYCVLGLVLVSSAQAAPRISMFLQSKMKIIMGPFLIVIGIFLLDIIPFSFAGLSVSRLRQEKLARSGIRGAFALGVVFALSFCPVSAALFFGSTFGLAVAHSSRVIIPSVYGIGTAVPVVAFALIIVFAAHSVGTVFKKISVFEKWSRCISGIIFIVAGIYLVLTANFHLF
ncbi:MAG: sulfite exporter TauE/SafE family protein [Chitinivibrionales bacterium]|nr:sulfite exporter TauE/SafE family protein [Chitinivibrionales bacterium]